METFEFVYKLISGCLLSTPVVRAGRTSIHDRYLIRPIYDYDIVGYCMATLNYFRKAEFPL